MDLASQGEHRFSREDLVGKEIVGEGGSLFLTIQLEEGAGWKIRSSKYHQYSPSETRTTGKLRSGYCHPPIGQTNPPSLLLFTLPEQA